MPQVEGLSQGLKSLYLEGGSPGPGWGWGAAARGQGSAGSILEVSYHLREIFLFLMIRGCWNFSSMPAEIHNLAPKAGFSGVHIVKELNT